MEQLKGTTILAVKKGNKTVMIGDGQVTIGESIVFKGNAHKVRRLYNDNILVGFAGGTADAFSLCEQFEKMLSKYSGSLMRSAVELAKSIRENPHGNSNAMMIVADKSELLILTSIGDVISPDDGVCAIGSGGNFALSAAKALVRNTDLDAKDIALKSMDIASDLCVFTNKNFVVEELGE